MSIAVNPVDFNNYRSFLADYAERQKALKPSWSLSQWAKQLGFSSPAALTMILKGQRHPSRKAVDRMCVYFGFDEKRKRYFHDLVQIEKMHHDKSLQCLLVEKIERDHPEGNFHFVDHDTFQCISNWFFIAIREMANLKDFKDDPFWISRRLAHHVPPHEVRRALKTLVELGLLERTAGKITYADGVMETSNDMVSEGANRFHTEILELAKSSLRHDGLDRREFLGTMFTLSKDKIPLLKEKLRRFQDEVLALAATTSGDETYHLNMNLFPLTRPVTLA